MTEGHQQPDTRVSASRPPAALERIRRDAFNVQPKLRPGGDQRIATPSAMPGRCA